MFSSTDRILTIFLLLAGFRDSNTRRCEENANSVAEPGARGPTLCISLIIHFMVDSFDYSERLNYNRPKLF